MDLFCYIESVRQGLCQARPDDTWESLWRRRRLAKAKNWTFWRAIIYALKKEIKLVLEVPLTHTWLGGYVKRVVGYASYYAKAISLHPKGALALNDFEIEIKKVAVGIETRQIEMGRDPPIFIPIPKLVELNSCARSDLPTCSLIL